MVLIQRTPWTPHDGSERPVAAGKRVTVIYRKMEGDTPAFANGAAGYFEWVWSKDNPDSDIMCFRLAGGFA
jgi:hypothetical protein